MEPEARYTLIGSVLLGILVAAVGAFVWLSSSGRSSDFQFFTVYFERQSLDGLQTGGDVNMRGVKVGRVETYNISRDNINRVAVLLRVSRSTPVSENTTAVVTRSLVTGIARINLETPGLPGPPLTNAPPNERYPVIPEGTSDLDQIANSVNKLAEQTDTALVRINQLLGEGNQKAVTEALVALRDLSQGMNTRLSLVDQSGKGAQQTMAEIRRASQTFGATMTALQQSLQPVSKQSERTLEDARAALKSFQETSSRLESSLSQSVAGLDRTVGQVAQRTDDALDIGVHELRVSAQELRTSMDLISRALDRLQDPKSALLGPSSGQAGPGEEMRQ
jgi:phospholipid/cholesterol/gamma-HCH transport system substrate-binding protein